MARTYLQAINRARRIVQDTDSTSYRYSDDELMDSVNDALLEVRRVRPELFLASGFESEDVVFEDAGNTALPIEDFNFSALVYLTAGYQMLRDDEFSLDSRAVNLLNKGTAQLITVAA